MNSPFFGGEGDRDSALRELLARRLGLHFPPDRAGDLERRIAAAVPQLGYADVPSCFDGLSSGRLGRRELEILASHLTVGESYFFRDPAIFGALEETVLPDLIRRRRESSRCIRLWSAGCSSGEEPYSLAMTLANLLDDLETWHVSVLATDINPQAIAVGREGVYGNWSFRTSSPAQAQRWLVPRPGGRRAVSPQIRSLVNFAWLNLIEDPYPAIETNTNAMDLIFCRNVLMYFHPERARQVLDRLAACLLDGGWLVVSPVEASLMTTPSLSACRLPGIVLYRKAAAAAPAPEPLLFPWAAEPLVTDAQEAPVPPSAVRLAAAPAAGDATIREARAMADRGRIAEALALCEQAIAADKLNAAWTYLRASMLVEFGEIDAAMVALRRSVYLDHGFVMAHFALGNLLLGRQRDREARRHFRNVLELLAALDPNAALPEADGMSAGRLGEIVQATLASDEVET